MPGAPGVVVLHAQLRGEHPGRGVELVGVAALRVAAGRDDRAGGQQAGHGVVHARHRGRGACAWRHAASLAEQPAALLFCCIGMRSPWQALHHTGSLHSLLGRLTVCMRLLIADTVHCPWIAMMQSYSVACVLE